MLVQRSVAQKWQTLLSTSFDCNHHPTTSYSQNLLSSANLAKSGFIVGGGYIVDCRLYRCFNGYGDRLCFFYVLLNISKHYDGQH